MNTPNNNGQNLDHNESEVSDSQIIHEHHDNLKYTNQHKIHDQEARDQNLDQADQITELKSKLDEEGDNREENNSHYDLIYDSSGDTIESFEQKNGPLIMDIMKNNLSSKSIQSALNKLELPITFKDKDILLEVHISPKLDGEIKNTSMIKIVDDMIKMANHISSQTSIDYVVGTSYLVPLLTKVLLRKYKLIEGEDYFIAQSHKNYVPKSGAAGLLSHNKYDTIVGFMGADKSNKIIQYIDKLLGFFDGKNLNNFFDRICYKLDGIIQGLNKSILYQNVEKKYTYDDIHTIVIPISTIHKLSQSMSQSS